MKDNLRIAVRSLVEFVCRRGDLGGNWLGPVNLSEAVQGHLQVQKSRPSEYTREVSVAYRLETDDLQLEIGGRLDGLYRYPDRVVIEEIKTTTRNLDAREPAEEELHLAQLMVYAYIYADQHGLTVIGGQLVYYHLKTGRTREIAREFTLDQLTAFFNDLIQRYLAWIEKVMAWRRVRDAAIREIAFPYHGYRPGQEAIIAEALQVAREGGQLLIQAPTGIGKTVAVLFSAIKTVAGSNKILFLTARTTGRAAAEQALSALRGQGLVIKALTMTAKEKICFRPDVACRAEECPLAAGYYDRRFAAMAEAFDQEVLTSESVSVLARAHQVCPYELSLDLSPWVDIIIGDFNHVFDPQARLNRLFQNGKEEYIFLVDEAHQLIGRAREMFSAELGRRSFLDLQPVLRTLAPEVATCLEPIVSWLDSAADGCRESGDYLADKSRPTGLEPLLEDFLLATEDWWSQNSQVGLGHDFLTLYFEVKWFTRVSRWFDEHYATIYQGLDHDPGVKLFCLDPSSRLEEALKPARSAVFFSATLSPGSYFQESLGLMAEARRLVLPSPFPGENFGLLIADHISTLYRRRQATRRELAGLITAFVSERPGNYLIFFPSYEYLDQVAQALTDLAPGVQAIKQSPRMTENDRQAFLARFNLEANRTLVGFAVLGGIFGEGIDLVGDRLTGVAIIGVGLPAISLENELIRTHFSEQDQDGFNYAYLYPGMNRVLQAAGRVIRSESDRGVVLLIDQRFGQAEYQAMFPGDWSPKTVRNCDQLRSRLLAFWGQGGQEREAR